MLRVLVTGGTGFVGGAVVRRLESAGHELTLAVRGGKRADGDGRGRRIVDIGDISGATDWSRALEDCGAVVHMAAQTPLPGVPDSVLMRVNAEGTDALAQQAKLAGVTCFVLLSSVFAAVDNAQRDIVNEGRPAAPVSPYGRSKRAAEAAVADFAAAGSTIVLRPPMVYGAKAQGNWSLLQKLAATGLPLPVGSVHNRRSLVSVTNLADAIGRVVDLPARSGTYLVCDDEPVSLSRIMRLLRQGMGLPTRLVPCPPLVLSAALRTAGRGSMIKSLLGDLILDGTLFKTTFAWAPPQSVEDGIRQSAAAFRRAA